MRRGERHVLFARRKGVENRLREHLSNRDYVIRLRLSRRCYYGPSGGITRLCVEGCNQVPKHIGTSFKEFHAKVRLARLPEWRGKSGLKGIERT
eukprot:79218-Amorphochlora_amoeboformis.AAC.1